MSYELEWTVDLISAFENTDDPKAVHESMKKNLDDESTSLLEVFNTLRSKKSKKNNKFNLSSFFNDV